MKRYDNPVVIARGLLGALCVITAVLANSEIIYADSTTDDLKAFLGITVEKHNEVEKYQSNYSELVDNTNNENTNNQIKDEVELTEVDILNQNLSIYGMDLNQLMLKDASPYEIRLKLNDIESTKESIKQLGYKTEHESILEDDLYKNNKTNLIVYESENDINSRWYDIGEIGGNLRNCVDNTFIIRPYGYEVEYNTSSGKYEAIGEKNRGLWLAASVGESVKAQFNGVVLSIEKDAEGEDTKNICIKHGNNVFTIYKHLHLKDSISVGSNVSQYEIIGTAGRSINEDYGNHIEIELIIDSMYINPLLMYGSSGKGMYENLIRSSEKVYAVEKGEGYYWNSNMSIENPNNTSK